MCLIAGIGRPRHYYLWQVFEIEGVKQSTDGLFVAFGTGWQLAPPQRLSGKSFESFKTVCANFVSFRRIDGLPYTMTLNGLLNPTGLQESRRKSLSFSRPFGTA